MTTPLSSSSRLRHQGRGVGRRAVLFASVGISLCLFVARETRYYSKLFHAYREEISTALPQDHNSFRRGGERKNLVGHLVPHSHCDAAYKKTVDEYYETEVRTILNAVVCALEQQPSRRFVWSETIFLERWWKDPRTKQRQRDVFQQSLNSGQLELVNGGYVMHDEAITRYDSQIDQMTRGHDLLREILVDDKNLPTVSISTGWQIDPFGAAAFTVNLYNWSGMDILVTNRFPSYIKEELKSNQSLEFLWEVPGASLLVHVFDDHYESPRGFDWENFEHPSMLVTDANVQNMSDIFLSILREKSEYYQTQHVLIPFGGDFRFQNASLQFQNMESIMKYVNANQDRYGGDHLQFSTIQEYKSAFLDAMTTNRNKIPVLTGSNFLPYWVGYYTQTPIMKQMVRTAETILGHCRSQLFRSFAQGKFSRRWVQFENIVSRIRSVADNVRLMQHHDALPSTSYKFVMYDYMKRLRASFANMTTILFDLLVETPDFSSGEHGRATIIGGGPYVSETILVRDSDDARSVHLDKVLDPQMGMQGIPLLVSNSRSESVDTIIHVVATRPDVSIWEEHDEKNQATAVIAQATPLEHELDSANLGLFLISFKSNLPPFGSKMYRIDVCVLTWDTMQPPPVNPSSSCAVAAKRMDIQDVIENGMASSALKLQFDNQTNDLTSLTYKNTDDTALRVSLNHDIVIYDGTNDTVYSQNTPIQMSDPIPILGTNQRKFISAFNGPLFTEVSLELTSWLSVRYRITKNVSDILDSLLHVTMLSGPVPPHSNVASRLTTNLVNTGWFYEENSFHEVEVKYDSTRKAGDGNVRPLTSRTWIQSKETQCSESLTVFSNDPRGVLSHRSGELDIFWKRRNDRAKHLWWDKTKSSDWWKQGDDKSVSKSSVWLSLQDCSSRKTFPMKVRDLLSSDSLAIKARSTISSGKKVNLYFPEGIRIVSLDFYLPETEVRSEGWLSLQIENYLGKDVSTLDLFKVFHDIPDLLLGDVKLSTLTFLKERPDQSDESPCRLEFDEGGQQINLIVGPNTICSLRIPVVPLSSSDQKGNSEGSLENGQPIISLVEAHKL